MLYISVFSVFSIVSFPNEACVSNLDKTNGIYLGLLLSIVCLFSNIHFSLYYLACVLPYFHHCCLRSTLRSLVNDIFSHYKTVSPHFGDNYALKCSSDNFSHTHAWKTVRTKLQCTVGLQSWGEGHEMDKNCGTNLSHSFPCF